MKNCWRRNVRPIKVIAVVAAIAATVLTATGSRANTLPAQAECIAPAKAGGGFDLTCKLTRQMLAGAKPLTISYLPGGIGALAFSTFAAKRRNEAGTLVAFSSGSLLNLAELSRSVKLPQTTLKRYLVQRGRPFLRAENPRYPDLVPATELIIQGVMVGLLRTHA